MKTKTDKKINKFKNLCNISQTNLKEKLRNILLSSGYSKVRSEDGFVFAQGELPVLLVAHMDTVHERLPEIITMKKEGDKTILSSPYGIGGDDRCGIFMILEIIKDLKCSVVFTEDEEIGGVGASKFCKSKYIHELNVNYIIEFDRAHANDAVFYQCDNPDFTEFITQKFYKTDFGSYSDICDIAPVMEVSAVNLSCGYYKAHTVDEYVVWEEMLESIKQTKEIIQREVKEPFEYIEAESYWYDRFDDYWGNWGMDYNKSYHTYLTYYIVYYDENENQTVTEVVASNKDEATLEFLMANDTIPYKNIVTIFAEDELNNF